MSKERDVALVKAKKMSLYDLGERIIRGVYTPGIEDDVLLERINALEREVINGKRRMV